MKQIIFTWAAGGEIYLKVNGEIKFRDCIQAAAGLMGHAAVKGMESGMISKEEAWDFFEQSVNGAKYIVEQKTKEG